MTLHNVLGTRDSQGSILLVGPVSYVGGVSVHIKRLASVLLPYYEIDFLDDSPLNISTSKYNIRDIKALFINIRVLKSHSVIHLHCGNWLLRILLIMLCFVLNKKIIVTLHSFRLFGLKRVFSKLTFKCVNKIICVNDDIENAVNLPGKTVVKEAFLPPVNFDLDELPNEVDEFIKNSNGRVLLCANAYKLTRWQGKDLYGLDQCVEVAKLAKENNAKLAIIFVIGTADATDPLFTKALKDIEKFGLESFIKIYPKSLPFIKLIQSCNIVLRPTLSDGDALTVREALFIGRRVIASDVVQRPEGTVLYKTGDANSLYCAILNNLENTPSRVDEKPAQLESYEKFYLDIYKQCSN